MSYYADFEQTEIWLSILDKLKFLKYLSALNNTTDKNNIIKDDKSLLIKKIECLVLLQQVKLK